MDVDGRIVILGASGVGKTALLQYLNGESIDTSYPSREYVLLEITIYNYAYFLNLGQYIILRISILMVNLLNYIF